LEVPKIGLKDFVENNPKPIQKTLFRPLSSNAFNAVTDVAKGTLNGIGIERNDFPFLQPPRKKCSDRLTQVLKV
jgi:hypothetical protein